ncbi:MAG TPA: tetratricopeptide repeat protein [Steroidobacteraceae bacterium]|nr:tetratricopeptide repeat protein [Steroidobacteraceae bacterium]
MHKPAAPYASLRRGLTALCAAVLCSALPARGDDLQDASKFLKAGQHSQALERVNKVLKAKPRDPQARFLKGIIVTEQGNSKEAIEIFTKLTQDYPELPEPYNNLAVIYASQGQYEKARAALEQSIRTHASYATAYENLGDVYAKLASQAYDKALQLDSSNSGAKNKLSLVRELVREPTVVAVAKEPPRPKEPAKPPVMVAEKAPEKPAADSNAEVLKAVNGWAAAWSKKDANAYLSYYAGDFKTPGGEARPAWEKARRERIAAPKSIEVEVDSPKVTLRGNSEASVTFRQNYRSDKLTSSNTKTLELVKADGRWQIREEKAGK